MTEACLDDFSNATSSITNALMRATLSSACRLPDVEGSLAAEIWLERLPNATGWLAVALTRAAENAIHHAPQVEAYNLAEESLEGFSDLNSPVAKALTWALQYASDSISLERAGEMVEAWLERLSRPGSPLVNAIAWAISCRSYNAPDDDSMQAIQEAFDAIDDSNDSIMIELSESVKNIVRLVPSEELVNFFGSCLESLPKTTEMVLLFFKKIIKRFIYKIPAARVEVILFCMLDLPGAWSETNYNICETIILCLSKRIPSERSLVIWRQCWARLKSTNGKRDQQVALILERVAAAIASQFNFRDAFEAIDDLRADNEWQAAVAVASHQPELAAVVEKVHPEYRTVRYAFIRRDDETLLLSDDPSVTPPEIRRILQGGPDAPNGAETSSAGVPSAPAMAIALDDSVSAYHRPIYAAIINLLNSSEKEWTAAELISDSTVKKHCRFSHSSSINNMLRARPDLFFKPRRGSGAGWKLKGPGNA